MDEFDNQENWVCGDCGTEWTPDVEFCQNKELDKIAVQKYMEGYQAGLNKGNRAVFDLIGAIKIVNSYGLGVALASIENRN